MTVSCFLFCGEKEIYAWERSSNNFGRERKGAAVRVAWVNVVTALWSVGSRVGNECGVAVEVLSQVSSEFCSYNPV